MTLTTSSFIWDKVAHLRLAKGADVMSVISTQAAEEKAAIGFVRYHLRQSEKNEKKLQQTANLLDVDPSGVKALARREMSLETAYRIASALDLHVKFAEFLKNRLPSLDSAPPLYDLPVEKLMELKLEDLDFGTHASGSLKRAKIVFVADLVVKSREEVNTIPGIGKKTLHEIDLVLGDYGLALGRPIG